MIPSYARRPRPHPCETRTPRGFSDRHSRQRAAKQSIQESGIARFDVLQQSDDPTRFILVEAYRTAEAPAAHKETSHYRVWRDVVAPMMAEPRSSVKFMNLFPADN